MRVFYIESFIFIFGLYKRSSMLPKGIMGMNYMTGLNLNNILTQLQTQEDKFAQFQRQKSYLIQSDWQINPENGGIILINKQKKKNIGKIIKFVLKKFITTGAFMGISFPVFAMKPESILQTYAKSIAAAPLFFDSIQTDPAQRVKKFVAFTFTFSRLFSDMDKPFNPALGETFQANIAGGMFSAEQTSHHPPQSSFYYEAKDYYIYGTLQLTANIGVSSASGVVLGQIHLKFKDGGQVFGRILSGEMSGFLLGQNKFRPQGSCYAYDPINKIICTYKREKKDFFLGELGILKQKYEKKFMEILKTDDRFTKYESFKQKDFECILSHMSACWTKHVSFNQKAYVNFTEPKWLPFKPTYKDINILPSDSRFRLDIKLRAGNMLQQSQQQKQKIENMQRYYRKLRKGEKNPKIDQQIDRMQQFDNNYNNQ